MIFSGFLLLLKTWKKWLVIATIPSTRTHPTLLPPTHPKKDKCVGSSQNTNTTTQIKQEEHVCYKVHPENNFFLNTKNGMYFQRIALCLGARAAFCPKINALLKFQTNVRFFTCSFFAYCGGRNVKNVASVKWVPATNCCCRQIQIRQRPNDTSHTVLPATMKQYNLI